MNKVLCYVSKFSPSISILIAIAISFFISKEIIETIFQKTGSPFGTLIFSSFILIFIWGLPPSLGVSLVQEDDLEKAFSLNYIFFPILGTFIFLSLFPWNAIFSEFVGYVKEYQKELLFIFITGIIFYFLVALILFPFFIERELYEKSELIPVGGFISFWGTLFAGNYLSDFLRIDNGEKVVEVFFVFLFFLLFLMIFSFLVFLVYSSYTMLFASFSKIKHK